MSLFSDLRQHIEAAFERAEKGDSKITDRILNMEGMSGRKTRHFYNNLLDKSDARYLEIGTWKGSSTCSAMCGNNATVVCIDNWSEFGGPKDEFLSNFNAYKGLNNARFIEQDCYKVDITQLPKFNMYMFDGNNTKDSHYKALVHYYNCLDDMFVFIVDDWNWKDVRDGTYDSFKQLQLTVLYEREIKTTDDDTHPTWGSEKQQQWHNGIYVAILQKTSNRLFNPSVSLPPITDAPLGNPAPPTTNVILTVFAGRHRYLSILKRYLDRLLEKNILTEVHLWDYAKDSSDSVYLREIERENPKYVYKKPIHNMPHWNEYYLYYTNASYAAEDIIIKCDDDVVYIDTDQMCAYINEIKQGGLYYPNIVNNDVCAYIQTKYGVHDLCNDSDVYYNYDKDDVPLTGWDGGWYARYDRAAAVHTEFLTNKKKFSIRAPTFPWKGRISINMFGARFATIKKYFELFMQHGKNNDEGFYSYDLYNYVNGSNYIVPFMNIVHFAFNPQNAFALDHAYLESYRILSSLPPITDALLGNPAPPTTNVILTIFAGRYRYLSILKSYLDRLLEKNILTEIHLWDYARDPSDSVYIQTLERENPKYVYKKPIHNMPRWNEYYLYYTNASYAAEDIIIKCDDDVVYIDTDQMCAYINEITQGGLYYPNIVNNDVCAYIQTKYGVHDLCNDSNIYSNYGKDETPLTAWCIGWYMKYECAAAVHSKFLENRKKFNINAPTISWNGRISINMFGARFESLKNYYNLFLHHGNDDDEAFFSYNLYKYVAASNYIVPFMNIVHFAFNPQNADALDNAYLESYRILSKRPDLNVFPHLLDLSHKDCIPANHFNYLKQLKASGFEPKVIYDIGSCVLHWTNKAKELWPDATYILFDAFREAEFLYSGYEYRMGVLCDQDNRELRFYKNVEQPSGNSYYREVGCENGKYFPEDRYTVEIGMRLDTIVKERGFPLPDLIKIDVQGAERDIISGGVNTISNATHMICEMQHTNYNDGAPKVSETLPYIESLGWECVAPMLQNNGADADYGFTNRVLQMKHTAVAEGLQ